LAERLHAIIDSLEQDHRDLNFARSTAKYRGTGVQEPLRVNLEAFTAINS